MAGAPTPRVSRPGILAFALEAEQRARLAPIAALDRRATRADFEAVYGAGAVPAVDTLAFEHARDADSVAFLLDAFGVRRDTVNTRMLADGTSAPFTLMQHFVTGRRPLRRFNPDPGERDAVLRLLLARGAAVDGPALYRWVMENDQQATELDRGLFSALAQSTARLPGRRGVRELEWAARNLAAVHAANASADVLWAAETAAREAARAREERAADAFALSAKRARVDGADGLNRDIMRKILTFMRPAV